MATKAPTAMQWGMPTVYNTNHVEAREWQSIDGHLAYQASVRHLQMPVQIGEPLPSGYGAGVIAPIALRVPSYTTAVTLHVLGSGDGQANPGVRYAYSLDSGATWVPAAPLFSLLLVPNDSETMENTVWMSTKLADKNDTPPHREPTPINVAWQAEEQEVWVDIEPVSGATIYAIWLQSAVDDNAELT